MTRSRSSSATAASASRSRPSLALGIGQHHGARRVVARARSTSATPVGVHASTTVIWLRVSVPVLSVQMNVVEPSVSTASRLRTSTWRLRHLLGAPRQRERHGRQQRLGDEGDGDADGEHEAVGGGVAEQHRRAAKKSAADADGDAGDGPHDPVQLAGSAGWSAWRSSVVSRAISASRVRRAGGGDDGVSASPSTTNVPANSSLVGLDGGRHALAGEQRGVDQQAVGDDDGGVGRDPVAGFEHQDVADDDLGGVDLDRAGRRGGR